MANKDYTIVQNEIRVALLIELSKALIVGTANGINPSDYVQVGEALLRMRENLRMNFTVEASNGTD